jgi:hypothetical protein
MGAGEFADRPDIADGRRKVDRGSISLTSQRQVSAYWVRDHRGRSRILQPKLREASVVASGSM